MFLRTALIVLPAPNGRGVKMLINATPIPAEAGDVESLVVTMQDLAPHLDPPALDRHPVGQVRQLRAHGLDGHLEPDPGQPGLLELGDHARR